jgi:Type II/IV secretion system protein
MLSRNEAGVLFFSILSVIPDKAIRGSSFRRTGARTSGCLGPHPRFFGQHQKGSCRRRGALGKDVLGEIRGGEAFDVLQLLNTGHSGTLSTVHANSAAQGISRFTTCVLQSGVEMPYRAIKTNIADSLNLIVQIERRPGSRYVSEVLEIRGYDAERDMTYPQSSIEQNGSQFASHGRLAKTVTTEGLNKTSKF